MIAAIRVDGEMLKYDLWVVGKLVQDMMCEFI